MSKKLKQNNWFRRKPFLDGLNTMVSSLGNYSVLYLHENKKDIDCIVKAPNSNNEYWIELISGRNNSLRITDFERLYKFYNTAIRNNAFPIVVSDSAPTELAQEVIKQEDLPILFAQDFADQIKINDRIKAIISLSKDDQFSFNTSVDSFKSKYSNILVLGSQA